MKPSNILNTLMLLLSILTISSCSESAETELNSHKKVDKKVEEPTNENTKKSENYTNIPNTHIFLDLPDSYKINDMILIKNAYTNIQVIELNKGDLYQNAANISREKLEKEELEVLEYQEFKLNEKPAIFFSVESLYTMNTSCQLVSGDSSYSIMLIGNTLSNDSESKEEIKKILLSMIYDNNHKIDYLKNAGFEYNKSASQFQFASATSNFYTFSLDGVERDNYKNKPFIIVSSFPTDNSSLEEIENTFKLNLKEQGIKLNLQNKKSKKVNGYDSFETIYSGIQENEKLTLYNMVLSDYKRIITIQGRCNPDNVDVLNEMKKFAHSIKIK